MNVRAEHPEFADWMDELRRVFGRAEIDAQVRRGMNGEAVFHVKSLDGVEPAFELGTAKAAPRMVLNADEYLRWGEKIAAHERTLDAQQGRR